MPQNDPTGPEAGYKSVAAAIIRYFLDFPNRWAALYQDVNAARGGLLAAVVLGWLFEFLFGLGTQPTILSALRVFCVLWFVSGAAFFVGTIAGFLFGIPRTRSGTFVDPSSVVYRYSDNTNLEEVSDWLTKIIVGISIAEFGTIVHFIGDIGNEVGQTINIEAGGKSMAIGSMIIGFACGFLFYYMWARVILHQTLEKLKAAPEPTQKQQDQPPK